MGPAQAGGRRLYGLVMVSALVLTACGSAQTPQTDPTIAVVGSSTTTSSVTLLTSTTSTTVAELAPADSVPDLSVFIATIEAAMEGTSYEGAALEDPEVFIATAQLFCELLDQGMTADEVLGQYLDRLSEGDAAAASDDDVRLAGVLLGASVEVVCPRHRDSV